jgi:hypothetical protein
MTVISAPHSIIIWIINDGHVLYNMALNAGEYLDVDIQTLECWCFPTCTAALLHKLNVLRTEPKILILYVQICRYLSTCTAVSMIIYCADHSSPFNTLVMKEPSRSLLNFKHNIWILSLKWKTVVMLFITVFLVNV